MPPSISLIVYAWLASESVARLFLAGIVPGILVAISFILYIRNFGHLGPMPREKRATLCELGKATVEGIPALIAPGIHSGSNRVRFATATEAGVIACGYSILIGLFYRKLKLSALWDALEQSASLAALIMMIIGVSQIMGWLFCL